MALPYSVPHKGALLLSCGKVMRVGACEVGSMMFKSKAKPKYKAISCKCQLGHIHDSRGEAGYCNTLEMLRRAGKIDGFEIQKKFDLKVGDVKISSHIVDFLVIKDGYPEVHEYKGFATDVWKLKHKLFEACFPGIPYKVIKHTGGKRW